VPAQAGVMESQTDWLVAIAVVHEDLQGKMAISA
jgi:hypothetical protein